MLIYNQAFDMYHTVYRMVNILSYFDRGDYVEIDRLRIWDYYFLFPEKVYSIKLKNDEKDIKDLIHLLVKKKGNPYNRLLDDRKMFEKIRPYQMNALKCLASYGLINSDFSSTNRVMKTSENLLIERGAKFIDMKEIERNVMKLMTSHFYLMPMYGPNGLKQKTGLLEFKYDA